MKFLSLPFFFLATIAAVRSSTPPKGKFHTYHIMVRLPKEIAGGEYPQGHYNQATIAFEEHYKMLNDLHNEPPHITLVAFAYRENADNIKNIVKSRRFQRVVQNLYNDRLEGLILEHVRNDYILLDGYYAKEWKGKSDVQEAINMLRKEILDHLEREVADATRRRVSRTVEDSSKIEGDKEIFFSGLAKERIYLKKFHFGTADFITHMSLKQWESCRKITQRDACEDLPDVCFWVPAWDGALWDGECKARETEDVKLSFQELERKNFPRVLREEHADHRYRPFLRAPGKHHDRIRILPFPEDFQLPRGDLLFSEDHEEVEFH